jgi:hypothetical protein
MESERNCYRTISLANHIFITGVVTMDQTELELLANSHTIVKKRIRHGCIYKISQHHSGKQDNQTQERRRLI